jgi:hypothetical protein
VEIHSPDLHIATLNDKGKLEMELDGRARPRLRLGAAEQVRMTRRSAGCRSTRSTAPVLKP